MRKLASELLRELEMRVASLEKEANRVITSSLSNDSKNMLIALSNHSRKTPIAKKGNFNILQEVLESLGFRYEFKEMPVFLGGENSSRFIDEGEMTGKRFGVSFHGRNSVFFMKNEYLEDFDTFSVKARGEFNKVIDHLKKLPYVEFVTKKPKKTEFGKVYYIFNENDARLRTYDIGDGNGPVNVRIEGFTDWDKNIYEGIKKVLIHKNGKKVIQPIDSLSNLEDFDLEKILKFAIKMGAVEDAKSLIISLDGAPVEDEEPQLTLLEQGKGTCCFCGSIQSLRNDQKIFKHGYRIQGWRETSSCYGSFQFPIEISSEGMKNVKNKLNVDINYFKKSISNFKKELKKTPRGAEYMKIDNEIRSLERSIKRTKDLITQLDGKIKSWKPQS